jgi:DNA invertase Pin-like site-specific DNA recombinase
MKKTEVEVLADALVAVGWTLAASRRKEETAKRDAAQLAARAIEAGISERDAAKLLGINRMSLRKWLGKAPVVL